jgi:preprotein translocase subunit Sss1
MSQETRQALVSITMLFLTVILILGALGFALYFIREFSTAVCAALECGK